MRVFALLALAGSVATAAAQTTGAHSLRWQSRAAVIASTGNRDLDDSRGVGAAYARGQVDVARGPLSARLEGWLSTPAFGLPSSLYSTQAWVDAAAGPLHLRLGRQIVNWGRTDRLNPTDSLSPRSLRLLTPDTADNRLGADMISLDLVLGAGWRMSAHHMPRLRADDLPRALTAGQQVTPTRPAGQGASQALKLDRTGAGLDASFSLFDGLATAPVASLGTAGLQWARVHRRVFGADASWTLSEGSTLRTEFADSRIGPASRELADAAGVAGSRWWVVGVERALDGGWLATATLSMRRNDVQAASTAQPESLLRINRNLWFQSAARDDAVVLAITRSPFEDDWSGEAAIVVDRSSHNAAAFQALLEHRIDDVQSWRVSLQWFRGPDTTSLGSLRRNSLAMLEWRVALGR